MRRVELFEHLANPCCGRGPVGVPVGGAHPGRWRGLVLCGGDRRPQAALDWRSVRVVREEASLRVAVGVSTAAFPIASRRPGRTRWTGRWSDPTTWGCAMPRPQRLSRRDHGRRGSLTRKVSTLCRDGWSVGVISCAPPAVALQGTQASQPERNESVAWLVVASM